MGREEVGSLENQGSQFPRHPTSLKNKTKFDNDKELQNGERSSRSSHTSMINLLWRHTIPFSPGNAV